MTDLRHAVHGLARQRTFSISILLILMLASGAAAVVLAVAQAVILRPLPYRDSSRLTVVWERDQQHGNVIEIAHRNYVDWRERAKSFDPTASTSTRQATPRRAARINASPTRVPL